MAAPLYNDNCYHEHASPPYSASVTDGERILELQPSQFTPSTNLPEQHLFRSPMIKLDLGTRIWPFSAPCFGYKGVIEGKVFVTTLEHVKRLIITAEATIKSLIMERGPGGHVESDLFKRSVILYTNNPRSPGVNLSFPFSISLPAFCDKSSNPLPPSFECRLPGNCTEIQYRIRVDMSRSGLRRRERRVILVVPILYLPRSNLSPTPWSTQSSSDQFRVSSTVQAMAELHLAPRSTPLPSKVDKSKLPPSADVQAKIALPSPLVVASGDRIPFVITIRSQSQALAALYTDIELQLVKVIIVKVNQNSSHRKAAVLAYGEVYESEEPGNGVRVLRGELGSGVPGAELSWSAKGIIEVRHAIRFALKPLPGGDALSANLPIFERMIQLEVMTHRYTPDMDATAPALGLMGLNII
ncbi:hypothetical protein OPQ81_000151 [Rhizoctonia solani]|nr:hypothetical protein OPQ81_000151 [Rhizoctonia solani]